MDKIVEDGEVVYFQSNELSDASAFERNTLSTILARVTSSFYCQEMIVAEPGAVERQRNEVESSLRSANLRITVLWIFVLW